jgi:hypothetical protein
MDADPSIVCGDVHGPHARMRAAAITTFVVYLVGFPLALAVFLLRHRTQVHNDQVLRERGEGDTALTNPNISFRRRYRKIYEDYKPQFYYWKLVLLARKAVFACIVVLLDTNVEAQASLSGAVLFLAYIVQQRHSPFVSAATMSRCVRTRIASARLGCHRKLDGAGAGGAAVRLRSEGCPRPRW